MHSSLHFFTAAAILAFMSISPFVEGKTESDKKDNPLANIPLRNIGPAMISGRISDFAFHPKRKNEFFAATASGNLWKTNNNGITWAAVFENEGAYAIGSIKMAPSDSNIVWVGTGENNAQRSVANGDGVYKSTDGGQSWQNMGLKKSDHISQIWIDPKNADIVLVASQGPLWNDGGDRGLFKTENGGKTWSKILDIDKFTGINEFVVDPKNHNNIVATSYQRRRHVWVLINGGPGSGVHKTTDGGVTWSKITKGLPGSEMGRIGIAMAPSAPNTLYTIIEAQEKDKGVYRSLDFGESWHKQSSHLASSPQYYNELVVDPLNPDRLYSLDTFTSMSEDAGKSFTPLSSQFRHVDDHALWIDPDNTKHLIIGGDGGIYETFDRGQKWRHYQNLPIVQFYRIQPDNAEPFYNICGGTQDNNSLCGPSRTSVIHGITNEDWQIVVGGDGYKPQIDPNDHNIIYAQYQYGGLVRYDRRSNESVSITPHPGAGENDYKWNWNSPVLLSPHSPTRLFYAAEKLFQSDDRGNSWKAISGDLTRKLDRNKLKVMDRIWSVDAIAKNTSTSMYGSIIALSESPLQEGLIYVGTDDGLISVTSDGGNTWQTSKKFKGVPDMSLVEDIITSMHDKDVAYAVFDNHKRGDFLPYVMKTKNRGKSWSLISNNLPERGSAHTIAEDHIDKNLLFVGTEYGLFTTQNGGKNWHQMKNGLPTIAVRDLEIQRRENDLIVGTFGRGIFIIDDYSPLRTSESVLTTQSTTLFPVKDAWIYIPGNRYGGEEKGSLGDEYFTSPNPLYGAVFSYYNKMSLSSLKEQRREKEKAIQKDGGDNYYPDIAILRDESHEDAPAIFAVIKDSKGNLIRRISAASSEGFHRIAWDMRYPSSEAVTLKVPSGYVPPWAVPPLGPLASPGEYSVTVVKSHNGKFEDVSPAQSFSLKVLNSSPELTTDRAALLAFQKRASELVRSIESVSSSADEIATKMKYFSVALERTPQITEEWYSQLREMGSRLRDIDVKINGDRVVSGIAEPVPWSLRARGGTIYRSVNDTQFPVSQNFKESILVAEKQLTVVMSDLKALAKDIENFESMLEKAGAPWTPGRLPTKQ